MLKSNVHLVRVTLRSKVKVNNSTTPNELFDNYIRGLISSLPPCIKGLDRPCMREWNSRILSLDILALMEDKSVAEEYIEK